VGEIKAHHLGIHSGELQGELFAGTGVNGREEVEVLVPWPHYGYGTPGAAAPSTAGTGFQAETAFIEKPDLDRIPVLLASGG